MVLCQMPYSSFNRNQPTGTILKIQCRCGALIVDSTDCLAHKAHLTPDQCRFGVLDAIDEEVINPLSNGELSKDDASTRARNIFEAATRTMWQCRSCGSLFIDAQDGSLQCFTPENANNRKDILAS